LPWGFPLGLPEDRSLDLSDGFTDYRMAVHLQKICSNLRQMLVRINEPGRNGFPLEVDLPRPGTGKSLGLLILSYFQKPSISYGHGLGHRLDGVHGNDIAAGEDDVRRRFLGEGDYFERYSVHLSAFSNQLSAISLKINL
jgi:hypothetical protein